MSPTATAPGAPSTAFNDRPEPVKFYKPRPDGSGGALSVQYRVTVELDPERGFVRQVDGGVFLELVSQGPMKNGNSTFNWQGPDRVAAKLGMADLQALLVSMREVRVAGRTVPKYLQSRKTPNDYEVSLFHQFTGAGGTKSTTSISYTFSADGGGLRAAKSRDLWRAVSLTLGEEFALERYLLAALDAFQRVGLR